MDRKIIVNDSKGSQLPNFDRYPDNPEQHSELDESWYFNSTISIVVNAVAHLSDEYTLNTYIVNTLGRMKIDAVLSDVVHFLRILAFQQNKKAIDIWKKVFGNVKKPSLIKISAVLPDLTKQNNFDEYQFTLRPTDITVVFNQEHLCLSAIASMSKAMADMSKEITAKRTAIAEEADAEAVEVLGKVVKDAVAPIIEKIEAKVVKPANPEPSTSWSKVAKTKTRHPPQNRKTVTGTLGSTYVGRKVEKHIKILVGRNFSADQVSDAVTKAAKSSKDKILVEPLESSTMAYRVKIQEARADLNLLKPDLWPTGMVVSRWKGPWYPLKPKSTIKIFVGNLSKEAKPEWIAQRVKNIYTAAGVNIEKADAVKFTGKRESKCLNLVISLEASSPGISMEPVQKERAKGNLPTRLFIRKFVEHTKDHSEETWT